MLTFRKDSTGTICERANGEIVCRILRYRNGAHEANFQRPDATPDEIHQVGDMLTELRALEPGLLRLCHMLFTEKEGVWEVKHPDNGGIVGHIVLEPSGEAYSFIRAIPRKLNERELASVSSIVARLTNELYK